MHTESGLNLSRVWQQKHHMGFSTLECNKQETKAKAPASQLTTTAYPTQHTQLDDHFLFIGWRTVTSPPVFLSFSLRHESNIAKRVCIVVHFLED